MSRMSIAGLASLHDSMERLRIAHAMLRRIQKMEGAIAYIRDEALLNLRERGITQQYLADALGISRERLGRIEKKARGHALGSATLAPWERDPSLLLDDEVELDDSPSV